MQYPTSAQCKFLLDYIAAFGKNKKIIASMDDYAPEQMIMQVEEDGARCHCFVDPFGEKIGDWVW